MSGNSLEIRPQKGPQEAYCASQVDIAIYGRLLPLTIVI